ncbi:dynamin family protein [Colletotrichum graminicola]|uniref:Dynamin family protein n=1 Tax=Colletotrichum graminicola (strain M1.001 / M2 / FGSC 10212) TaxID=645133 RepID=E3QXC3_COLGM|nr:dynamin family protein [Colletotrichum graminicola M1.001]EFQ35511.1 dynamin family protein [Colletotrichum graminicola M1.001]WDK08743.1 dynamin family protein [Colletotrichum graminicola]
MSPEPNDKHSPLTSPDRLRKIDQLRERNIGAYLPLPQLVAVGDQSSGKSSLLESLTGIPFPRGQELCTRYATQITHRRETQQRIDIAIIPGPNASKDHRRKLELYRRQVQTTAQLRREFPSILEQANALMGIKTISNPAGENTFSEDILKIEKCGPNEDYLTIIDVPGIFRTTTEGVTTNKDKELVKDMVKRYIKDSRTIVLAVLPSNVDVATQEILTLAEEVDPAGDRTLGILTKADLVTEQTARLAVVNLAEGKRKPLKLGYHVITNRGGDDHGEEDTFAALQEREAIFQERPWDSLPKDRIGISSLRERLEELLGEITDRAFPELRSETRQKLANAEKKLKDLGVPRQTEREQRQYLVGISSSFQSLVRAAVNADYSAHPAFDRNALRLITAVVNTTEQFNTDFDKFARMYLFESEMQVESMVPVKVVGGPITFPGSLRFGDDPSEKEDEEDDTSIIQFDAFDIPTPGAFPDLDSIITTDWSIELPKQGIMEWIAAVHRQSRGLDLGSFGQGILPSVFREQSAKWEKIAKQYLSKIILLVHHFILAALEIVCADTQVFQNVSSTILDELCARYEGSMDQATLLGNVERQLKPYTLNHYFNHNQQKSFGSRIMETLRPNARTEQGYKSPSSLVVDLSDVADAVTSKSNTSHAIETIHDTLEAYYKVAYKRFVDNVFSQAVNYKLLSGPESPLRLFSEQWVLCLDPEKLLVLAGESRRTREQRERLKKEIQDLEVAMEILR